MAKHRNHSRSKSKSRTRSQRGGNLAGNPASVWGWTSGTLGNGFTQFMNSLSLKPGMNLGTQGSNSIVPVNNLNANDQQPMLKPNLKGGSTKKHRRKNKTKRGGGWSSVVNQAVVPGALLAAQQFFSLGQTKKQRNKLY